MRQSYSVKMSGEQAADLLLLGVHVHRVGVTPPDPNLYVTVRHLYHRQSSIIRNVWTGEEQACSWDEIEFA